MSTPFTRTRSPRVRAAVAGVSVLLTGGLLSGAMAPADAATGVSVHQLSVTTGGQEGTADAMVTSGVTDFDSYLAAVVDDTATYWQGRLTTWSTTSNTAPWQQLHYSIIDSGDAATSQCTDEAGDPQLAGDPDELGQAANPAFFCSQDMTVYLSSPWLYDHIWSAPKLDSTTASDFGVAYAIAHEVGHAVQHDLGISEPAGSTTVASIELQADCLAGVWSNAKYYQNELEGDDIDEAVAAASSVGDYDFDQVGHHGTPEERTSAFMTGYNNGAGGCTTDLPGSM